MHIFYAWEWGAGVGHLRRFAPIAEHLHARGHRITVVARDTMQVRQFFPRQRFGLLQAPVQIGPGATRFANPHTIAGLVWNLGFDHPHRIEGMFDAWSLLMRQFKADALISDFGLAAAIVARAHGIPTVRMGTGFECPPAGEPLPSLFGGASTVAEDEQRLAESMRINIDRALGANGLRPTDGWAEILGPPDRCVLATLPPLDPYQSARGDAEYVGVWDSDAGASPRWPAGGELRALAYLKPFPMLARLLAVLNEMGIGVSVVGDGIIDRQLRDLDERMTVVCRRLVNLREAAAQCQLMITNGNHGTTVRALALGLPVLVCPLFIEQRLNARAVEAHRLGVSVRVDQPEMFATGIARLLGSPELGQNVRRFAAEYEPLLEGAEQRATERIEKVLLG